MKKLLLIATALAALSVTPASAVVWDMSGGVSSPGVSAGTTHTFTSDVGGFTILASGFTNPSLNTPLDMFLKNTGGDEVGLGFTNESDHEIAGSRTIVINLGALVHTQATAWSVEFGSTTDGESWIVKGSNTGTSGSFVNVLASVGPNDEGLHNISGAPFQYLEIMSTDGNVLLAELNATGGTLNQTSAVPEPGTWGMMLLGFVGLGFAFRQRRRMVGVAA
jgi:hypothetical protein